MLPAHYSVLLVTAAARACPGIAGVSAGGAPLRLALSNVPPSVTVACPLVAVAAVLPDPARHLLARTDRAGGLDRAARPDDQRFFRRRPFTWPRAAVLDHARREYRRGGVGGRCRTRLSGRIRRGV